MEAIKFYTLDEVKDKHIGEVGTPVSYTHLTLPTT